MKVPSESGWPSDSGSECHSQSAMRKDGMTPEERSKVRVDHENQTGCHMLSVRVPRKGCIIRGCCRRKRK